MSNGFILAKNVSRTGEISGNILFQDLKRFVPFFKYPNHSKMFLNILEKNLRINFEWA